MSETQQLDFMVQRTAFGQSQWAASPSPPPLAAGQARLRVDRFALTANNITYARLGDAMRYWNFFPAPAGWGRIPVWGHADVVASRADGLSGRPCSGFGATSPRAIIVDCMQPTAPRASVVLAIALTALYWFWESRAQGNIRVDLLLIYPLLFTCYTVSLWPKLRFWSLLAALGLMAINLGVFVMSYSWFGKNPG